MTEKSEKKSVFEGERYTPLFEDMPEGMLLSDIAVYGYIRRMEQLRDKKCTASSATIGKAIHANEKTVDRSLSRLEGWNVIRCTHRGSETKEASHFITLPVSCWHVDDIQDIAEKKTIKRKEAYKTRKEKEENTLGSICPETRVNLSGDRVN